MGNTIMQGDADLTGSTIDLGTPTYTRSAPLLDAAIDARIGAPW